jgi:hypothetical protein
MKKIISLALITFSMTSVAVLATDLSPEDRNMVRSRMLQPKKMIKKSELDGMGQLDETLQEMTAPCSYCCSGCGVGVMGSLVGSELCGPLGTIPGFIAGFFTGIKLEGHRQDMFKQNRRKHLKQD